MIDTGKRYHIVDTSGNHYKLNGKNNLVIAQDNSEATLFTLREANTRIGTGHKSRFYNVLEADVVPMPVEEAAPQPEESYNAPELDGAFDIKVRQSLEVMEKMKERQYTPRKLSELFDQQQRASA